MKRLTAIGLCLFFLGCAHVEPQQESVNKAYFPSGVLKSVWVMENGQLNGIKREYTAQGVLQSATNYKNGKIDGIHNMYREDGSLWTKEIYENGKLITRQEFDDEGYLTAQDDFDN